MREPSICKGCIYSKVYPDSGWECEARGCCKDGSQYVSKGDAKLSQYPEGRRES